MYKSKQLVPLRQVGVQEFDIVSMVKTRLNMVIVKDPKEIKYHLEKGILFLRGKPVCLIDIPGIYKIEINPKPEGFKARKEKSNII